MRVENRYFEVFPRLLPAWSSVSVHIRPLFDHCTFCEGEFYKVTLIPVEGSPGAVQWPKLQALSIAAQNGQLEVPLQVEGEQEYLLTVEQDGALKGEFRLFALEEDLFNRRPYKGDFHLHSAYSDGRESPAYVAASCRKIGMDFMAITDHRQYAPSLEAMHDFEGVDVDLRIYPGEEVHPPNNRVHILHFGGKFSINELFTGETYKKEVKKIGTKLTDLPAGIDRNPYASCVWCYDKIREAGGLGIFCHPYWISRQRCDVPQALTNLLMERQPFDALELIGGYHPQEIEANTLQVARYQEERAQGKRIPIVGVSDSHGCETGELFGWYYTVAFAFSSDLPDLIKAIKDCHSVAVEALPGQVARAYGPFRLVRYAQFLMREIFPLHDELCAEEGRWMLAYAAGDEKAVQHLKLLQGRVKKLYAQLWGVK